MALTTKAADLSHLIDRLNLAYGEACIAHFENKNNGDVCRVIKNRRDQAIVDLVAAMHEPVSREDDDQLRDRLCEITGKGSRAAYMAEDSQGVQLDHMAQYLGTERIGV